MKIHNLEDDLILAHRMADISDILCLSIFQKISEVNYKIDKTPVTELDIEIESVFRSMLQKARPNDIIIGEELGGLEFNIDSEKRKWIIDPIDHTRHFIKGNADYGTLISLVVNGQPSLGLISMPSLKSRWWAIIGGGAWFNGNQIFVSKTKSLNSVHFGIAGHLEWHEQFDWNLISDLIRSVEYAYGTSGGFSPAMLVASACLDAFVEPWGSIWDHTATSVIITEAGGKATTLDGSLASSGSLLVSNGVIHDEILSYFCKKIN